jgi:hypothetical protein
VEEGVHLERPVEVVLAVQDGYADIAAGVEERFEVVGARDWDRLVASLSQLRVDSERLLPRKSDGDC